VGEALPSAVLRFLLFTIKVLQCQGKEKLPATNRQNNRQVLLRLLGAAVTVTRPIRTGPGALPAFWATLTAGSPGAAVTFGHIARPARKAPWIRKTGGRSRPCTYNLPAGPAPCCPNGRSV